MICFSFLSFSFSIPRQIQSFFLVLQNRPRSIVTYTLREFVSLPLAILDLDMPLGEEYLLTELMKLFLALRVYLLTWLSPCILRVVVFVQSVHNHRIKGVLLFPFSSIFLSPVLCRFCTFYYHHHHKKG
jgi:hypothetical protein